MQRKVRRVMNHDAMTIFLLLATLYALFGDDIKVAFFSRKHDDAFNVITIVIMCIFVIEIIVNSLVDRNYPLSFYFYLDIISTVSLIMDISWIWDNIIGEDEDYSANDSASA